MSGIICDTPEAISLFRWLSVRGSLRLEKVGLKRRGMSAKKSACLYLGLKPRTPIDDVIAAVETKIASFSKPVDGVRTI